MPTIRGGSRPNGGRGKPVMLVRMIVRKNSAVQPSQILLLIQPQSAIRPAVAVSPKISRITGVPSCPGYFLWPPLQHARPLFDRRPSGVYLDVYLQVASAKRYACPTCGAYDFILRRRSGWVGVLPQLRESGVDASIGPSPNCERIRLALLRCSEARAYLFLVA
jgi:hypothetical protein